MFKVSANNCSCMKITFEVNVKSLGLALEVADTLAKGFCDVDVISNETGEVYFRMYRNEEVMGDHIPEEWAISRVKRLIAAN